MKTNYLHTKIEAIFEGEIPRARSGPPPYYPTPWDKTFTWRPRIINSKMHWLKTVYVRENKLIGEQKFNEYGDVFDLIRET